MKGPEADYFRELKAITDRMEDLIRGTVLEGIERLIPPADASQGARAISTEKVVKRFERLEERIEELSKRARGLAGRTGISTSQVHRAQTKNQLSAIGIDIFRDSPQLESQLRGFTRVNTNLIKSIPRDELSRVEAILVDAVRTGRRHEDVADDIKREFNIAENRAKLIARDQIGKIASDLSRSRMQSNGVSKGVWRTSQDERVRSSHEKREGQTFDLDKGIQGEHPGGPVGCRCYTEPHL